MVTRREFLDTLAIGAAGLTIGSTAKSYAQIMGSNDRLNFAVIGLNSRAYAHLSALKANKAAARISHVCDVDTNILKKFADATQKEMGEAPATEQDFRKILAVKESTRLPSPLPTTGIRRWRSLACRRARMFMSRSRAATIPPRERC